MDSIFGLGKELAKAERNGYGHVGIARSKAEWKRQPDGERLLPRGDRSSLYGYRTQTRSSAGHTVRSPIRAVRSPIAARYPQTFAAKRKHRPSPLDLSSISSFSSNSSRVSSIDGRPLPPKPVLPLALAEMDRNPILTEIDVRTQQQQQLRRKKSLAQVLKPVKSWWMGQRSCA